MSKWEDWVVVGVVFAPYVGLLVTGVWLGVVSRREKQLRKELERRLKVWVLK